MHNEICPICEKKMATGYQSWHLLCESCGYEKANLESNINVQSSHQLIDEKNRKTGLQELRAINFQKILEPIKRIKPDGGLLLDVGCAHGWFLEIANNDFEVLGIEPDEVLFGKALGSGQPARLGYFPNVLNESEKFDIIVFNDVIEHIHDINSTLEECHRRLNKDGLLVLNLPSSKGIFYRVSKMILRLGISGFFDRLWQKDLPSPHLHYFNTENLNRILNNNQFETQFGGTLTTLKLNGLYTRISYTGRKNVFIRLFVFVVVALSLPILTLLPKDIMYAIAVKRVENG